METTPSPQPSARPSGDFGPSRRVFFVGLCMLTVTVLAMTLDRRKPRTGELLIQHSDAKTQIRILQNDKPIVEATDRRSFQLLPGVYRVVFRDPTSGVETWRQIKVEGGTRTVVNGTIP